MEMVLGEKDASDWIYRGEGAVNLVLAYSGSSPAFVGKVMRIQKVPKNGKVNKSLNGTTAVLTSDEQFLWRDNEELLSSQSGEVLEQKYVEHVMIPLLGAKHVDAGMHLRVSREFLESVERKVSKQRPSWRVEAAGVDMLRDSVLLMNDHALLSHGVSSEGGSISVEIKPKCGFLPSSRFIREANGIKRSVTRFRMHQMLKLRQNEITELSEYDPLDLFSGCKDRIHKAIRDLYATPQNNFRVFLNGSIVLGQLGGATGRTSPAIGQAFEDALKGVILAEDGLRTKSFIQLVAEAVYRSGVLDRLLEAQKLDNVDIEGAIHAYYDIISEPCLVCREYEKDEIPLQYTSLHSLPLDESLKVVKNYLIAATAKDCSFMISFRPREAADSASLDNNIYLESTDQIFDYKVCFIDLDLKPLENMEAYYLLDQKIVNLYTQKLKTDSGENKAGSIKAYESIN